MVCAGLWLLVCAAPVASADEVAGEEQLLKAVFIFNFAKFTRWPENAWKAQADPLVMCTAGEDALVEALGQLGGKTVQGRPVNLQRLAGMTSARNCHVIYIAVSEQKNTMGIIKSVQGEPVLTVSELPQFDQRGGIIKLYRENGRIRFIINLSAANGAGLTFSSRLLDLAVVVNQDEAP